MQRTNSLEKTLILGKIEGKRRRGRQRWLDDNADSKDMNLSKLWELVMDREAWHSSVHWIEKTPTGLSDRTELNTARYNQNHGLVLVLCSFHFNTLSLNSCLNNL